MAIENRNVQDGDAFVATYKKVEHRATAFDTPDGIRYTLHTDDSIHKSLSAAGSKVMDGIACNGWRFWTRAGDIGDRPAAVEPAAVEPQTKKAKPAVAPEKRVLKVIKRVPNQKGVEDGFTKWHCSACMESFVAAGKSAPAACPKGHAATQDDDTFTVDGATDAA